MSKTVGIEIETITCATCGIAFGAPGHYFKKRREDHRNFYCPNGHVLGFTGKSEAERLRDQLKWSRERAAGEQRRAEHAERRLAATKGVVTKLKKRVGAGVCPCCNRHFSALQRHMETQHPEFVDGEAS